MTLVGIVVAIRVLVITLLTQLLKITLISIYTHNSFNATTVLDKQNHGVTTVLIGR